VTDILTISASRNLLGRHAIDALKHFDQLAAPNLLTEPGAAGNLARDVHTRSGGRRDGQQLGLRFTVRER